MKSKFKKLANKYAHKTVTNLFALSVFYFACDYFITKNPDAINGATLAALSVVVSLLLEKR